MCFNMLHECQLLCSERKAANVSFVRIKKLAGHTTKPVINGVTWLMAMGGKIHQEF